MRSALVAARARSARHRAPPSHERWLVSYADFLTLLFGFFVVMYAISSVDDSRFDTISEILMQTFNADQSAIAPIQVGDPARSSSPSVIDFREQARSVDTEQGDTRVPIDEETVRERFAGLVDDAALSVTADNDWLQINMDARVLFAAGRAELNPEANPLLDELAAFLGDLENRVTVEGYTDNTPTSGSRYPSNWELSGARAASVVRALTSRAIAPERLSAIGHGENYPIETNGTADGRAANRRVSVVVARTTALGADDGFIVRQVVNPEPSITSERTEDGGLRFVAEDEP